MRPVFADGGRLFEFGVERAAPWVFTEELALAPDPAQLGRSEWERAVLAELFVDAELLAVRLGKLFCMVALGLWVLLFTRGCAALLLIVPAARPLIWADGGRFADSRRSRVVIVSVIGELFLTARLLLIPRLLFITPLARPAAKPGLTVRTGM